MIGLDHAATPDEVVMLLSSAVGLAAGLAALTLRVGDLRRSTELGNLVNRARVRAHALLVLAQIAILVHAALRASQPRSPQIPLTTEVALWLLPLPAVLIAAAHVNDLWLRRVVHHHGERQ